MAREIHQNVISRFFPSSIIINVLYFFLWTLLFFKFSVMKIFIIWKMAQAYVEYTLFSSPLMRISSCNSELLGSHYCLHCKREETQHHWSKMVWLQTTQLASNRGKTRTHFIWHLIPCSFCYLSPNICWTNIHLFFIQQTVNMHLISPKLSAKFWVNSVK